MSSLWILSLETSMSWDAYFLSICDTVAQNSKCHSRQIGAILVQDKVIIATGYNGPPRGVGHCEGGCPRRAAGYRSGERLDLCPATHAEQNCVASAARIGAPTKGATLYINTVAPCKWCMGLLINAGVKKVVAAGPGWYDDLGLEMARQAGIDVRYPVESL
jgi:dCMP deaminase